MAQLIKKNPTEGGYNKVYPNTFLSAIVDEETGKTLKEILSGFNSFYVSYTVDKGTTRLQIPSSARKRGIWISYAIPSTEEVVTEYYNSDDVDDTSFKNGDNWKSLQQVISDAVMNVKFDNTLFSEAKYALEGEFDNLTADRAVCDSLGNIIHDVYLTRESIGNTVTDAVDNFLSEWKYNIADGTITYDMLSDALKQLFEANGTSVTNNADEEDITVKDNQLKFKDRTYEEQSFNGMGYKILRMNMMDNVNLLEQSMIDEENTIYEIRYTFCLDETTITIPDNCILKFNGGSIENGTVNLNGAKIIGLFTDTDFGSATIEGTYATGQTMYFTEDNTMKYYNGTEWVSF